jgi:heme-degrading monooxygenase HmoA
VFSVIFEVHPRPDRWDTYLGIAKGLRPELEQVDGFVDNVRYRSLTREGWLLSLSGWRDEKALVRWRTRALHHEAQEKGRGEVFLDYRLRVGEVIGDTNPPAGVGLQQQRLDETATDAGTTVTLIDAQRPADKMTPSAAEELAQSLGLDRSAAGLLGWDVFDAVLTPGDVILLLSWRDRATARMFENGKPLPAGARRRSVRVVRAYGMYDRREAPQFYPDAPGRPTVHS